MTTEDDEEYIQIALAFGPQCYVHDAPRNMLIFMGKEILQLWIAKFLTEAGMYR